MLLLLLAVPVLALFNVFGQSPVSTRASVGTVSLLVNSPSAARGGDIYETRFRIRAPAGLVDPRLVLAPGWFQGITVNTYQPAVTSETSTDGHIEFSLGKIPAGHTYVLIMQFQVNPTAVGEHNQDVALYNGASRLLFLHRTITLFP